MSSRVFSILIPYSLFPIHFNDIDFRGAEEAHVHDGADAAGDKDEAVVLKGEEACGHGGTQGDGGAGKGVANLPTVGVAGEHEVPIVGAQQPAAFGVVREEEDGAILLPGGAQAGSRGFVSFIPVSEADDAQGCTGGGAPIDALVAEQGDASGGVDSFQLAEFFVVVVAEDGEGGGDAAELPEPLDGPAGAHESLVRRDDIAAEEDEVRLGCGDAGNGLPEKLRVIMDVGEEGDSERSCAGQGGIGQLQVVALQLPGAVFPEADAAQPADESQQGKNNEPGAELHEAVIRD